MRKITKKFVVLAVLAVFSAVVYQGRGVLEPVVRNAVNDATETLATEASPSPEYKQATLSQVVDGDTVIVWLDGVRETVRFTGIDAPESVHVDESRNCEEGRIASAHLKEMLFDEQTLWLERDVSDRDKYGRLLRYVWTEDPSTSEVQTGMLNAVLVSEGYAQAKDFPPDSKYKDVLAEMGRQAAENELGVSAKWAKEV